MIWLEQQTNEFFSTGDTKTFSSETDLAPQVTEDTIPSYRTRFSPERHNEALLRKKELTMEGSDNNKK